jgi:Arylsulfotransferase (ASST)
VFTTQSRSSFFWLIIVAVVIPLLMFGCSGDENEDLEGDDDSANDGYDPGDDFPESDAPAVTPHAQVSVEAAPEGNPLARKLVVTTDVPCSISGFVTTDDELGYGPSYPRASKHGTVHELWFFGLLEDRKFQYTLFSADLQRTTIANGTFRTPLLPDTKPVMSQLDYVPPQVENWPDWYMVTYSHKIEGDRIWLVLLYDRLGRIRYFHPSGLGQFVQTMPNGDFVGTQHTALVGARLDGSEYTVFNVALNEPVHRNSHHKFHLKDADANTATVIFGRYGPGVECDLTTPTENNIGDGIAEIDKAGNELWRWDIFDHLDQIPPDAVDPMMCLQYWWGPNVTDWTHGNSVRPVPGEDAYIVSYRNISRIVQINRTTGDLDWQLGPDLEFTWLGPEPENEKWFHFQHDAHWLSGNRLLLYDNNDGRINEFSRGLELQVDFAAKTVKKVWEYRWTQHQSEGNIDLHENGNRLIAGGSGRWLAELPTGGENGDELFLARFESGMIRAEYYPTLWLAGLPPL